MIQYHQNLHEGHSVFEFKKEINKLHRTYKDLLKLNR